LEALDALFEDFFAVLARWQDGRTLWLLGGGLALGLELFSVLWIQKVQGLFPCELCVKIRLAMWGVGLGAGWAALAPRRLAFKLPGYALTLGSAVAGLRLSTRLEAINVEATYDPQWLAPCVSGRVSFPGGLRLDKWLPLHFRPDGVCGETADWSLLGLSMTQWLMTVYAVMIVGLLLMLASFLAARLRAE
jgi:disulfide bond formation protein DsbB